MALKGPIQILLDQGKDTGEHIHVRYHPSTSITPPSRQLALAEPGQEELGETD